MNVGVCATSLDCAEASDRDDSEASSPPSVLALVPAHNEQAVIGETIASLQRQTCRPDRIVVVLDDCSDATAIVAVAMGVETFATRDNRDRKAGALNQALDHYLPGLRAGDSVLVVDADTTLSPDFIEVALRHAGPGVGRVGGVLKGDQPGRYSATCSGGSTSGTDGRSSGKASVPSC